MAWTFVLGGVGLFLLGMNMMTDGLKDLAGDTLKRWLHRFTGGTFKSILSGALITAVIQSSSAATIITIGFVSAGLLTFTQAIGVIIGANIGSTSTGWIVSLIGFKVNLQAMALPIIGVGIFLKIFASERFKVYGTVLTGFGLLFLGIKTLQDGMVLSDSLFIFDVIAENIFLQKLLLISFGFLMTVIMQSSSAAVATTLTILHTGGISFEQAAFLVIGQNIGTTVTALLASIGASIHTKRTAVTHVLFNLGTGTIAVLISPFLLTLTVSISTYMNGSFDAAFGIAIFHTLFNILGVLLFVPFISRFENLVTKLFPEKGNPLTRYLDPNVASVPPVAIEAASNALLESMRDLTGDMIAFVKSGKITNEFERNLQKVEEASKTTRGFLKSFISHTVADQNRHLSIVHALDHIERLIKVLREEQKIEAIQFQGKLMTECAEILEKVYVSVNQVELKAAAALLEETSLKIANVRRIRRNEYFLQSVRSETELDTALAKVQALLWIDRMIYHYWRAIVRLTDVKSTVPER